MAAAMGRSVGPECRNKWKVIRQKAKKFFIARSHLIAERKASPALTARGRLRILFRHPPLFELEKQRTPEAKLPQQTQRVRDRPVFTDQSIFKTADGNPIDARRPTEDLSGYDVS